MRTMMDAHWDCTEQGCNAWGAYVYGEDREGVTRWIPATGEQAKRKCYYHGPSRRSL